MKCVTSSLTAANRPSKQRFPLLPTTPRTPKPQVPTLTLKAVPQNDKRLLTPSDSGQSTRSQSPCNSLEVSRSAALPAYCLFPDSENRCPNTPHPKPPRSQVVIYRKSPEPVPYTQLAAKHSTLENEHLEVLALCETLLADVEQLRGECSVRGIEEKRVKGQLEQANERISQLMKRLNAKESRVEREEEEMLITTDVAFALSSELEMKRDLVLRQARTIAELSQELQKTQCLLDQANSNSLSLLSESKSLKLALSESQYRESSLRATSDLTEEKLRQERQVVAELSQQLGETQDQLVSTMSRLVAAETANSETSKRNAELMKKVAELESSRREISSECEKLRFYGSDESLRDINYRKLCQLLLSKDCFQQLRQLLGPDFSQLVQKYEREIELLERRTQGLETSLEVMEMRLEAASYPN